MFTTGVPELGSSFFTAASMLIAIPAGVQIFCWIATIWEGRPVFRTPLLFVIGFILVFVIGGISGVMVASVQFDSQVHDTYFIVAHLHYVLFGGMVFPMFGAFYYWFPKFTGRMLSERLGQWHFWMLLVGFNVTFFPMHQLGFDGMPRRVYTYDAAMGWGAGNLMATVGSWIVASAILVFIVNAVISWRSGRVAGDDPWHADSLEWFTPSPPPQYNFAHIPVVSSRWPLWDQERPGVQDVVSGIRSDRREVLVTTAIDAEPQRISVLARPSLMPLALALACAVAFVGAIWSLLWVPIGALLAFVAMAAWHWPVHDERTPPWNTVPEPPQEVP
jgi:cytochrome c oxidase subunit I+III